jgi:hypothetical protein
VNAFGITRYELLKLCLHVATLVAVMVLTVWMNVRLGEIAIENAKLAKLQSDEAEARARWTEDVLSYTRGEQSGLKDRVEKVEQRVDAAPPKVVVVISTPKPIPSTKPTAVPDPTATEKPIRGGLGAIFSGDD